MQCQFCHDGTEADCILVWSTGDETPACHACRESFQRMETGRAAEYERKARLVEVIYRY